MPEVLTPITGDPFEVTSAGRTLVSIAADVATQATRLRALASRAESWSGQAATQAHSRAATLPPKLDKVDISHNAAGSALLAYATALLQAQDESATAIATAARADSDLQAARNSQSAAAAADARAATAARDANLPAPPPTAPRYEPAIAQAATRYARAVAANVDAHRAQAQAARTAATMLKNASREGIRNQSWWHHVTNAVTHWATAQWSKTLSDLSRLAATISTIATIAAVVLAVAGILFPPLEAAAAVAESVATISGMVASDSAVIVALADPEKRRNGLVGLAEVLVPSAARKLTKLVPGGANRAMGIASERRSPSTAFKTARADVVRHDPPLGFSTRAEFEQFGTHLQQHLAGAGYPDTVGIMQGSAVTGAKYTTGAPFDEGRRSDFDIALGGPDISAAATAVGIPFRNRGLRTGPLETADLEALGLPSLEDDMSAAAGRSVKFMIYRSSADAVAHKASVELPR